MEIPVRDVKVRVKLPVQNVKAKVRSRNFIITLLQSVMMKWWNPVCSAGGKAALSARIAHNPSPNLTMRSSIRIYLENSITAASAASFKANQSAL